MHLENPPLLLKERRSNNNDYVEKCMNYKEVRRAVAYIVVTPIQLLVAYQGYERKTRINQTRGAHDTAPTPPGEAQMGVSTARMMVQSILQSARLSPIIHKLQLEVCAGTLASGSVHTVSSLHLVGGYRFVLQTPELKS